MKTETKYQYQKRIKELEQEASELRDALDKYKSACMSIHDDCIEVMKKDSTGIKIWSVMNNLRRVWTRTP